jgi:hypothetical protein
MSRTIPANKVKDLISDVESLNELTEPNQRALRARIAEIKLQLMTWAVAPLVVAELAS